MRKTAQKQKEVQQRVRKHKKEPNMILKPKDTMAELMNSTESFNNRLEKVEERTN